MALSMMGAFSEEDCCGMDGAVLPISDSRTLRKSCQKRIHQFRHTRYPEVCKNRKAWRSAATAGSFCNPGGEKFTVLRHIIATTDKTRHWIAGRHDRMYRVLGFFAARRGRPRCGDGRHVPDDYRRITRFTPRACNPRLSRCSSPPLSKTRMTNFYAIGKRVAGRRIKKLP